MHELVERISLSQRHHWKVCSSVGYVKNKLLNGREGGTERALLLCDLYVHSLSMHNLD